MLQIRSLYWLDNRNFKEKLVASVKKDIKLVEKSIRFNTRYGQK